MIWTFSLLKYFTVKNSEYPIFLYILINQHANMHAIHIAHIILGQEGEGVSGSEPTPTPADAMFDEAYHILGKMEDSGFSLWMHYANKGIVPDVAAANAVLLGMAKRSKRRCIVRDMNQHMGYSVSGSTDNAYAAYGQMIYVVISIEDGQAAIICITRVPISRMKEYSMVDVLLYLVFLLDYNWTDLYE
ncbi:hypothetical protein ACJX0J_038165 [Zea mays]